MLLRRAQFEVQLKHLLQKPAALQETPKWPQRLVNRVIVLAIALLLAFSRLSPEIHRPRRNGEPTVAPPALVAMKHVPVHLRVRAKL
jgi:hypothetical protein